MGKNATERKNLNFIKFLTFFNLVNWNNWRKIKAEISLIINSISNLIYFFIASL